MKMSKLMGPSHSKGNHGNDDWHIVSDVAVSEAEATAYAQRIWGSKRAQVRNMAPSGSRWMGRVHGVSGFPSKLYG